MVGKLILLLPCSRNDGKKVAEFETMVEHEKAWIRVETALASHHTWEEYPIYKRTPE